MTKEELIEALKATLAPGESVTVERPKRLESLTDGELMRIHLKDDIRAVVMADRKREVERMREAGTHREVVRQIAEFLGVEVEL